MSLHTKRKAIVRKLLKKNSDSLEQWNLFIEYKELYDSVIPKLDEIQKLQGIDMKLKEIVFSEANFGMMFITAYQELKSDSIKYEEFKEQVESLLTMIEEIEYTPPPIENKNEDENEDEEQPDLIEPSSPKFGTNSNLEYEVNINY